MRDLRANGLGAGRGDWDVRVHGRLVVVLVTTLCLASFARLRTKVWFGEAASFQHAKNENFLFFFFPCADWRLMKI